jgi:K+-sensing histidine kinase KdpD
MVAARALLGLLLCFATALISARLFVHSPLKQYVPLGFAVVLVLLAARFGAIIGALGTVVATLVFAHSLFAPLGSIHVEDGSARTSLSWMILCAIAMSFLLFPPQRRSHRT